MRSQRVFVLIVISWYLILSVGHYFNQRPLWNDEQCVLNNILQLKPQELFTRPLLDDQAFPRLYLWSIQNFSKAYNYGLLALRFFSLAAMIAAFFVWTKIARRVLGHAWDLILFIFSWCGSIPLVYYAAELKPYSMDVLSSGLIVFFLLDQNDFKKNPRVYRIILFFLPLLDFWSYPVFFLSLLVLYNLVRDCLEDHRWVPELSIFLAAYLLSLGLVYYFDLRVSDQKLMVEVWHDYFISADSLKDFLKTFGKGMNNLIARSFAENPKWVKISSRVFIGLGVGYMLAAFGGYYKKDRFALHSIVTISVALFLLQLLLAILKIFPFAVPRLSLFFLPMLLLMAIMAMRYIYMKYNTLGIFIQLLFAGYLGFVSLGIAWDVFLKGDLGAEATLYSR